MRDGSRRSIRMVVTLAALVALAAVPSGATNGYFSHGYGTADKALAGAGVALPQDALAAATNPAGLAFLGHRYDAGLAFFSPDRHYTITGAPSGFPGTLGLVPGEVRSDSRLFFIPHFGAVWDLGGSTAGLAIYGHGGMNTDWPTATFYASSPTGVDLSQLFIAPTWAKRIGDKHAFGVTALFAYQRFEIQGVASFAPFSADPAHLSNNGHDDSLGFGFKVGYLGRLSPRFSIGASYQSKMSMGDFSDYAGLFAEQGGFDIPATWTAGVAIGISSSVTLLLDVQETLYSDVTSIGAPLLPNLVTAPLGSDGGAGFGWQDETTYKLGLQIDGGGDWIWRLGVSDTEQPIPSSEVLFNILAPGVVEAHYTAGFTRRLGTSRTVNLAVMYAPSVEVAGANPLEVPGLQTIGLELSEWDLELSFSWGF